MRRSLRFPYLQTSTRLNQPHLTGNRVSDATARIEPTTLIYIIGGPFGSMAE